MGRMMVHAANLIVTEAHVPDCTQLRARVTDGPVNVVGRVAVLYLTDDEVRAFLADLAMHPHWALAVRAAAEHPAVVQAAGGVIQLNSVGKRLALNDAMKAAMDQPDR